MDVSIIIVSWNVKDLLGKCLESIFKHTKKENTPTNGAFSVAVDQFGKPFLPDDINISIAQPENLSSKYIKNQKQPRWSGRDSNPQFSSGKKSGLPINPTAPLLGAAIRSITRFEVVVIDNASTDGTVLMLAQNFNVIPTGRLRRPPRGGIPWTTNNPSPRDLSTTPMSTSAPLEMTRNVKLIVNHTNKGFAAANNQGIQVAKGKYILLLNPDTELTENTLKKVFDKMESDSSIGVLGCKLLNSDGTLQPSVRRFPRVRDILVMLLKLHKIFPGLLDRYLVKDFDYVQSSPNHPLTPSLVKEGEPMEVDQVMGAFFCIRREVIEKIGLLDEGYFIWFEEVDFCRRAKAAGFKVVYWPGASIIHHGGQSFAQAMTLKKQWWFFKSAMRYFLKK